MEGLITVHDIQHVVVDNLQCMFDLTMRKNYRNDSITITMENDEIKNRFADFRTSIVSYFRQLTRKKNVHVTLILHPDPVSIVLYKLTIAGFST